MFFLLQQEGQGNAGLKANMVWLSREHLIITLPITYTDWADATAPLSRSSHNLFRSSGLCMLLAILS
jgi:hypothetical protein